jgi:5-hydroxyisourate hydrolase
VTTLSTHVLDVARGVPARGIAIALFAVDSAERRLLAQAITNADGRTDAQLATNLAAGTYELVFAAGPYLELSAGAAFYDDIAIRFRIAGGAGGHYHVPLLLAPWGYSTYRGS